MHDYVYLFTQDNREELFTKIVELKDQILGSDDEWLEILVGYGEEFWSAASKWFVWFC